MRRTKSFKSLPKDESTESSLNLSPTSVADIVNHFEIGSGFEFESDKEIEKEFGIQLVRPSHIKKQCNINIEAEQLRSATLITMMLAEKKQLDASHRSRFFFSNKNNVNDNTQNPDLKMQEPV
jgi:hypothetical protein